MLEGKNQHLSSLALYKGYHSDGVSRLQARPAHRLADIRSASAAKPHKATLG